ncbi:MAG: IS607 family transposase [Ardenticatenales bacterium]|nr:IS607 family transposase [Ardenticatenales bacterium]
MKLSEYARQVGVSYKTAWRWFHAGKLQGYQMDTGTILVTDPPGIPEQGEAPSEQVAIYSRVSAAENRPNLDAQAARLLGYCMARGYQVHQVVKEVGSGVNDNRPKLLSLLTNPRITVIVVEHKDRLTRFGFRYIEHLLALQGRRVEVVNHADNGREDLLEDLGAIIYSFCARLYGQRRAKRKTEVLIAQLTQSETASEESGDATG